jgi:hypothetical protein
MLVEAATEADVAAAAPTEVATWATALTVVDSHVVTVPLEFGIPA